MPVEARVALICAKYAVFGIIPLVIPPLFPDVPIPVEQIPAQQGTDLAYIKQLADEVGYVFYVEPGPAPGTNIAYFGPEIKVGVPQPALNVNMDAHTNVESLSFSFDPTKGVLPVVFIQNQLTQVPIPIPIPNLNPLHPPLGRAAAAAREHHGAQGHGQAQPDAGDLARARRGASARRTRSPASGSLDVLRYGRLLKARAARRRARRRASPTTASTTSQSVTSTLKRGEFKQSFTLTRNGLISITPRVPV